MKRVSGLLVAVLLVACSPRETEDGFEERAAEAEQGGEDEQDEGGQDEGEQADPLEALAARPPEVAKIEVELASPDPAEPAQVFITYAQQVHLEQIPLQLDDGEIHMFNDAGAWPDEAPGDGVWSGTAPVDLALDAEFAGIYLDRVGGQPDPVSARFAGRHLVGLDPFDPGPFEQRAMLADPAQLEALVGRRIVLFDREPSEEEAADQAPSLASAMQYAPTHDWENTLLVHDLAVVEDPTRTNAWSNANGTCQMVGDPHGEWAFQTLMENVANPAQTGISLHDFVTDWLLHWGVSHAVQGDTVPAQPHGLRELWHGGVFSAWAKTWDDGDINLYNDILDMDQAPFRLIAIVNRVDLRGGGVYGGVAGELRFVFEMIDPVTCQPRPFNVILEFGVPIQGCAAIRDWGQQWYDLDALPVGSPNYNAMLSAITTQVTTAGVVPKKPNGSAVNQIRTNENFMVWPHYPGQNWQLREFRLPKGGSGFLEISPLVQTPEIHWEVPASGTGVAPIDGYISANVSSILANTHQVGPSWSGQSPFQGAYSGYGLVDCFLSPCTAGPFLEPRGLWWGTAASGATAPQRAARHEFSLDTCNGCHGRETLEGVAAGISVPSATADQPFRHVQGHGPGTIATLSRFLTGTQSGCNTATNMLVPPLGPASNDCASGCCPIGDPVHGYTSDQVHFADLLRRQQDLDMLVTSSCLISVSALPLPSSH